MKALFSSFKRLPVWLRISILVTEGLFVLILVTVLVSQLAQLNQIERERQGAERPLGLSEQLTRLSEYSANCSLAATPAPEAANYAEACARSKANYEAAVQTSDLTFGQAQSHAHSVEEQSLSYQLEVAVADTHLNELLARYFRI